MVAELLENIENREIEEDELVSIMTAIGNHQCRKIFDDSVVAGKIYKDDEKLQTFDPASYFMERNPIILGFFKGVMGENFINDESFATAISGAIESIYYLRNKNFIGPLTFAKSLLLYTKTGSKEGLNIVSAASPSGSYTLTLKWLKAHSQERIRCPGDNDIISFSTFNNQVIGRKWRVKTDFKAESSVITAVVHMVTDDNIQTRADYSPFIMAKV